MTLPEPPSDAALLEYAFRSPINQRVLMNARWTDRSLPAIRATILRMAGLDEAGRPIWETWAEREKDNPVVLIQEPVPSMREPAPPTEIPAPIFRSPQVPRRFDRATLDTYRVDYSGHEYADQLTAARTAVDAWVRLALAGKAACVALVGTQGNGKSHLLWGAVKALSAERVKCYARPWYRLADELRYGGPTPWLPGTVNEPWELRKLLQDSPAVAIDEVCATAGTTFDESELGKIVKGAWDNRQALLVTTNVHPLSNLMGDAAADRFTVVQLTAPSGRNRT